MFVYVDNMRNLYRVLLFFFICCLYIANAQPRHPPSRGHRPPPRERDIRTSRPPHRPRRTPRSTFSPDQYTTRPSSSPRIVNPKWFPQIQGYELTEGHCTTFTTETCSTCNSAYKCAMRCDELDLRACPGFNFDFRDQACYLKAQSCQPYELRKDNFYARFYQRIPNSGGARLDDIPNYGKQWGECLLTPYFWYLADSASMCAMLFCNPSEKCRSFMHDRRSQLCVLYDKKCQRSSIVDNQDFSYYWKKGAAATTAKWNQYPQVSGFTLRDGNCPGSTMERCWNKQCKTPQGCASLCSGKQSCKGITFDFRRNECILKSRSCSDAELRQNTRYRFYTKNLDPSQPSWSQWGSWGSCSVTCGEGIRTRTRECNGGGTDPNQIAPRAGCPGYKEQEENCNLPICGGPSPSTYCYKKENGNCPGNMIVFIGPSEIRTLSDCQERCNLNRECLGITYQENADKGCYLKRQTCTELQLMQSVWVFYSKKPCGAISTTSGTLSPTTSGFISTKSPTPPTTTTIGSGEISGYRRRDGNCGGNILTSCAFADCSLAQLCAERCTSDPSCKGFSFNFEKSSTCYLKLHSCQDYELKRGSSFTFFEKLEGPTKSTPPTLYPTSTTRSFTTTTTQGITDVDGYIRRDGNCAGNTLQTCPSHICSTATVCGNQCTANPNCKGFSFNFIQKSTCYLKTASCSENDLKRGAQFTFFEKKTSSPEWCNPNPCRNGGECVEEANGYVCNCVQSWSGSDCEIPKETGTCASTKPCFNDGTCTDISTSDYDCTCKPGFIGDVCELVDYCFNAYCENGGTCSNLYDGFHCTCFENWMGPTCNIARFTTTARTTSTISTTTVSGVTSTPFQFPNVRGYQLFSGNCRTMHSPTMAYCPNYKCNTPQKCAKRCDQRENCLGFTYNIEAGQCYMKSRVCTDSELSTVNPRYRFYKKVDPNAPVITTTTAKPFTYPTIVGYSFRYGDCSSSSTTETCSQSNCDTAVLCATLCSSRILCRGFSFDFDRTICYLKSDTCSDQSINHESPTMHYSRDMGYLGCGVPTINPKLARIIGGEASSPNSWPWVAMIFNNGVANCGGALIDRQWVLSASHCFGSTAIADPASRIKVKLGKYNRNYEDPHEQTFKVTKIISHKNFDHATFNNDIALLKLDAQATINAFVSPVCLAEVNFPDGYADCYVIGWGVTDDLGSVDVLNQLKSPIIGGAPCTTMGGVINSTMFCAGYPQGGKDSCAGDSGGPLQCRNNIDHKWYQFGIVSWGYDCAKPNQPGVYTRIPTFRQWIFDQIRLNS